MEETDVRQMIVWWVYNYNSDKCLEEKSQFYDSVNRGDPAYSGVCGTESRLVKEGLSEEVALLEGPGGCVGVSGSLRQRRQQVTSPDMGTAQLEFCVRLGGRVGRQPRWIVAGS